MKHIYFILMAACFSFCDLSAESVHVTVPGTLDDAIADMGYFEDLTVTGTLDSSDFMTLGGISSLENLDLRGATVVNNRVPREAFFYSFFLTSVKLPPTVTSIGAYAFAIKFSLEQIELPTSLKSIDEYAFVNCTYLTQISLPASLERIGAGAFYGCSELSQIHIPLNVRSIGNRAFYYTSLTAYTVDPMNQYFTVQDGVLFNKDMTTLCSYPSQKTALSYTIPSTVETIAGSAFDGISHLSSIIIPSSVNEIYVSPFSNCPDLTSIQVEADNLNYASLNDVLFNKGMTILIRSPQQKNGKFEVPAAVKYITDYAFYNNQYIDEIILPQNLDSIGIQAFYSCENLSSPILHENLKEIHAGAFYGCKQIERMIIPTGIDSLPVSVLSDCENLKTLILPSALRNFNYTNLDLCSKIDSIWTNSVIPPAVPTPFYFNNIDTINSTLYVPKGSLAAYKNHNFWKHFPTEEIEYTLELSANSINSEAAGLESEFSINSNTEWSIAANQNWIHISKQKGWFDGKIGITVDANSGITREGAITVSGLGIASKSIEIQQAGLASGINEPDEESVKISLDRERNYLSVENASGLKLYIYSISGECLMMKDLKSDYEVIDIQNMPSGIYLVKAGKYSTKVSK